MVLLSAVLPTERYARHFLTPWVPQCQMCQHRLGQPDLRLLLFGWLLLGWAALEQARAELLLPVVNVGGTPLELAHGVCALARGLDVANDLHETRMLVLRAVRALEASLGDDAAAAKTRAARRGTWESTRGQEHQERQSTRHCSAAVSVGGKESGSGANSFY